MRPQTLELFLSHNVDESYAEIARAALRAATKIHMDIEQLASGHQEGERMVESKKAIETLTKKAKDHFVQEISVLPSITGFFLQGSSEVQHIHREGSYIISLSPLDGATVVDSGYATGSLIGIYAHTTKETLFSPKQLVGTMYVIYGTSVYVGVSFGKGLHIFKQHPDGVFHAERAFVQLTEDTHIAALGGFDTMAYVDGYRDLALKLSRDQFTLRYSGSVIADMHLLFMKGGGLFIHHSKKLFLLTQCAPIGFMLQQTGGIATNGSRNILAVETTNPAETTLFLGGTKEIVENAMTML